MLSARKSVTVFFPNDSFSIAAFAKSKVKVFAKGVVRNDSYLKFSGIKESL